MLAFLDSPVQLIAVAVVLLIVFGPNKLPEILGQLGKAMREFRRYTSELSNTLNTSYYDSSYQPTRYDSYGNPISDQQNNNNGYSSSSYRPPYDGVNMYSAYSNINEPPKGDAAAPALAPTEEENASQGITEGTLGTAFQEGPQIAIRPAEGTVPRKE
ncbi:MAG TPA: twin-arginine translocase TatA/TatE family subunit [Chthonomonas sp.]|uniref:Sec-independent protein translocase subunit TatA/TatB n=1 Tax=Chthonomonas sp. TaxID=2282153 RepID=UPI002B4B3D1C|nr:twin-arginine translocase TatA/TatE family subunit [Chthonomonas sp.]HLI47882.1 twin-arginine translocase TatA/TatE family subunit [Chthonomonas sp.]